MLRILGFVVLLVSTHALAGEYEHADEYSSQSQRDSWQEGVATSSAVQPHFVWHPLGHLMGMAAAIPADPMDWLDGHREQLGIPDDGVLLVVDKQSLYLPGNDPVEEPSLDSGYIETFEVFLGAAPMVGVIRVISQDRGGLRHITGLISGIMPELKGRQTSKPISEAEAWFAAGKGTGKALTAERADLVYASAEWILWRTPSLNKLYWRLIGHDDHGRVALLLDSTSGAIGLEYEPDKIEFAPRHERHFPYDYVSSSPPTPVYDATPPNAPMQCTQASLSPPCTNPAYAESLSSRTLVPAVVDYWHDRSSICNQMINNNQTPGMWPFTPSASFPNRCQVGPVSAGAPSGSSPPDLRVVVAHAYGLVVDQCSGLPCWNRGTLFFQEQTVTQSLVGHEWGHETLKNVGRFVHDSFPPSMPNAVTEFYADGFGVITTNEPVNSPFTPTWALGTVAQPAILDWSAVAGSCSSPGGVRALLGASTYSAFDLMANGYWLSQAPQAWRKLYAFKNIESGLMRSIAIVPDYPALPEFVAAMVALATTCPGAPASSSSPCYDFVAGYFLGGLLDTKAVTETLTSTGQVWSPCAP